MPALIAASAARTCLGDEQETYAALLAGRSGLGPLRHIDPDSVHVRYGYHVPDADPETPLRPSAWLAECAGRALKQSGVDPRRQRVLAVVGTGLRELRAVEREVGGVRTEQLHFAGAVQSVAPIAEVCTLAGACSAGGHALALGQDAIELGDADAVLVAAADGMTESMLAMMGRVVDEPTDALRPFDTGRTGVLLGEGAAALVLVPESSGSPLARLVATGLSCDAGHETAPDVDGICRAMRDAFDRADRHPADVGLVIAHGTGTALNDPAEATALHRIHGASAPLATALKGAIGHTSGSSALHGVAVAIECLRQGRIPPVVGLREPIEEARSVRLVRGTPVPTPRKLVQVNAFGFGGVNAVTLLETA